MSLREYTHMDAAATRLTQILRKKNIAHMFIGGYAASLIGGERVTEDVDVITEKNCRKLLLNSSGFSLSTDNRIIYSHDGTDVLIDVTSITEKPMCWLVPDPRAAHLYTIFVKDLPHRNVHCDITILHPSVLLLTKLPPYHTARNATRQGPHRSLITALADIKVILKWLVDRERRLNFNGLSQIQRGELLRYLATIYRAHYELRGLMAMSLAPDELRDVLLVKSN